MKWKKCHSRPAAFQSIGVASTVYLSTRPNYWRIELGLVAFNPGSWRSYLNLFRRLGKKTPALWCFDSTEPDGSPNYDVTYYAVFEDDFDLAYQEGDYASTTIKLRQVVD